MSKFLVANAVFAGLVSLACAFTLEEFNAHPKTLNINSLDLSQTDINVHRRRPDEEEGQRNLKNASDYLERSLENIPRVANIEFTQRGIDILKYEIAQDMDEFFTQFEKADPTTRTLPIGKLM